MVSPRRILPAAILALCASAAVHAAELGDVHVGSHSGQPLVADIELTMLEDAATPVQVRVASRDVYDGAGIAVPPVLSSLNLSVMRRDGRQFLHVTSLRPVDADHVHLYLELVERGQRAVRLATLWLTPDPDPAPAAAFVAPAPVPAPARVAPQVMAVPARPMHAPTAVMKDEMVPRRATPAAGAALKAEPAKADAPAGAEAPARTGPAEAAARMEAAGKGGGAGKAAAAKAELAKAGPAKAEPMKAEPAGAAEPPAHARPEHARLEHTGAVAGHLPPGVTLPKLALPLPAPDAHAPICTSASADAQACTALGAKNAELRAQLSRLEDKVRGLQEKLGVLPAAAAATKAPAIVPPKPAEAAAKAAPAPVVAKPAEGKSAAAEPAESKSAEVKSAEAKPADAKPADAKPAEAQPDEAKPATDAPKDAPKDEAKPKDEPKPDVPAKPKPIHSIKPLVARKPKAPAEDDSLPWSWIGGAAGVLALAGAGAALVARRRKASAALPDADDDGGMLDRLKERFAARTRGAETAVDETVEQHVEPSLE